MASWNYSNRFPIFCRVLAGIYTYEKTSLYHFGYFCLHLQLWNCNDSSKYPGCMQSMIASFLNSKLPVWRECWLLHCLMIWNIIASLLICQLVEIPTILLHLFPFGCNRKTSFPPAKMIYFITNGHDESTPISMTANCYLCLCHNLLSDLTRTTWELNGNRNNNELRLCIDQQLINTQSKSCLLLSTDSSYFK